MYVFEPNAHAVLLIGNHLVTLQTIALDGARLSCEILKTSLLSSNPRIITAQLSHLWNIKSGKKEWGSFQE